MPPLISDDQRQVKVKISAFSLNIKYTFVFFFFHIIFIFLIFSSAMQLDDTMKPKNDTDDGNLKPEKDTSNLQDKGCNLI